MPQSDPHTMTLVARVTDALATRKDAQSLLAASLLHKAFGPHGVTWRILTGADDGALAAIVEGVEAARIVADGPGGPFHCVIPGLPEDDVLRVGQAAPLEAAKTVVENRLQPKAPPADVVTWHEIDDGLYEVMAQVGHDPVGHLWRDKLEDPWSYSVIVSEEEGASGDGFATRPEAMLAFLKAYLDESGRPLRGQIARFEARMALDAEAGKVAVALSIRSDAVSRDAVDLLREAYQADV